MQIVNITAMQIVAEQEMKERHARAEMHRQHARRNGPGMAALLGKSLVRIGERLQGQEMEQHYQEQTAHSTN